MLTIHGSTQFQRSSGQSTNETVTSPTAVMAVQLQDFSSNTHYEPDNPKYYNPHKASSVLRACTLRLSDLHDRVFIDTQPGFSLPAPVLSPQSPKLFSPSTSTSSSRLQPASVWPIQLPEAPSFWIALYFFFNLTLTLYNKSVLIQFPFPYTLTALHALCGTVGSFILLRLEPGQGRFSLPRMRPHSAIPVLHGREKLVLLAFSILYTINIAVSNVSLRLVTVPFHQVVRASTPLFTIIFSTMLLGVSSSRSKVIALIPVVAGVGFATYGDYYFTLWGFFLTLLGTLLAALKTIFTNILQSSPVPPTLSSKNSPKSSQPVLENLSKLSLTPLHLLYLLSPIAFVQSVVLAHFSGELEHVRFHLFVTLSRAGIMPLVWLTFNGVLAFGLNMVSFNANRRVGALGMTVAANVKQVLTILCAVSMFDLKITPANGIGIVLTLAGGAWFAFVELSEKQRKRGFR